PALGRVIEGRADGEVHLEALLLQQRGRVGPDAEAARLVAARRRAEGGLDGAHGLLQLGRLQLARQVAGEGVVGVDLLVVRRADPRVKVRADAAAAVARDLAQRAGAGGLAG